MVDIFKKDYPLGVRFWAIIHLLLGILFYMRLDSLISTYSVPDRTAPLTILFNAPPSQIKLVYTFLCIYYIVLGITVLVRSGFGWMMCIGEFVYIILLTLFEIVYKSNSIASEELIRYVIGIILGGLMIWYFLTQKVRDYFQLGMEIPWKIFWMGLIMGFVILLLQVVVYFM